MKSLWNDMIDSDDALLTAFAEYRPLLFSIAYRMLGSVMDAEDIVQDVYLRWQKVDAADVENVKGFLTTMATRMCIDFLKSARVQREEYIGPWLPEPMPEERDTYRSPADMLQLSESLSMAFLVMLETLTPDQRAVFILHDVFGYSYGEVAEVIGKSESTCRQLASRARQYIRRDEGRFEAPPEYHSELTQKFLSVVAGGDVDGLVNLLAEDVVAWSDGGGKAFAARRPIYGIEQVVRFLFGIKKQADATTRTEIKPVNGRDAVHIYHEGRLYAIMTLQFSDEGKLTGIYSQLNPDKLAHLQ